MYRAIKTFNHDELGRVIKGQEFEATAAQLGGVKAFVEKLPEAAVDKPEVQEKPTLKRRVKKAD